MRQPFVCDACGLESEFDLPGGLETDALVAFQALQVEHDKRSPECGRAADVVERLKRLILTGEWPHTLEAGILN